MDLMGILLLSVFDGIKLPFNGLLSVLLVHLLGGTGILLESVLLFTEFFEFVC